MPLHSPARYTHKQYRQHRPTLTSAKLAQSVDWHHSLLNYRPSLSAPRGRKLTSGHYIAGHTKTTYLRKREIFELPYEAFKCFLSFVQHSRVSSESSLIVQPNSTPKCHPNPSDFTEQLSDVDDGTSSKPSATRAPNLPFWMKWRTTHKDTDNFLVIGA
jgi:hypothetical protein